MAPELWCSTSYNMQQPQHILEHAAAGPASVYFLGTDTDRATDAEHTSPRSSSSRTCTALSMLSSSRQRVGWLAREAANIWAAPMLEATAPAGGST